MSTQSKMQSKVKVEITSRSSNGRIVTFKIKDETQEKSASAYIMNNTFLPGIKIIDKNTSV